MYTFQMIGDAIKSTVFDDNYNRFVEYETVNKWPDLQDKLKKYDKCGQEIYSLDGANFRPLMGEKIEPENYPTLGEVRTIIEEKVAELQKQMSKNAAKLPRKSNKASNESGVTPEDDGSSIAKGSNFNKKRISTTVSKPTRKSVIAAVDQQNNFSETGGLNGRNPQLSGNSQKGPGLQTQDENTVDKPVNITNTSEDYGYNENLKVKTIDVDSIPDVENNPIIQNQESVSNRSEHLEPPKKKNQEVSE